MKRLVLVLLGMFILTSLHASPTKEQKTEMYFFDDFEVSIRRIDNE